jgi:Mitochondrial ribosomal protein L27
MYNLNPVQCGFRVFWDFCVCPASENQLISQYCVVVRQGAAVRLHSQTQRGFSPHNHNVEGGNTSYIQTYRQNQEGTQHRSYAMNRLQSFFRNNTLLTSIFTISVRHMSKNLSKAATKRLPLTTKKARKGYYKGKGGTKEGHITSKGRFIVDKSKRLELIIPDLEGFKVSCSYRSGLPMATEPLRIFDRLLVICSAETVCSTQCREAPSGSKKRRTKLTSAY